MTPHLNYPSVVKSASLYCDFSPYPPPKCYKISQKATYFRGKACSLPMRLCGIKSILILKIFQIEETSTIQSGAGCMKDTIGIN